MSYLQRCLQQICKYDTQNIIVKNNIILLLLEIIPPNNMTTFPILVLTNRMERKIYLSWRFCVLEASQKPAHSTINQPSIFRDGRRDRGEVNHRNQVNTDIPSLTDRGTVDYSCINHTDNPLQLSLPQQTEKIAPDQGVLEEFTARTVYIYCKSQQPSQEASYLLYKVQKCGLFQDFFCVGAGYGRLLQYRFFIYIASLNNYTKNSLDLSLSQRKELGILTDENLFRIRV